MTSTPAAIPVAEGAGFIGSDFIHSVLAVNPQYSFVKGEAGDAPLVARLLAGRKIDAIAQFTAGCHVNRDFYLKQYGGGAA